MTAPAPQSLAQGLRRGVLLVNVGTPDAPTPAAVRRYLREFLGDPRVVDLSAPARWLLLNLVILPFRPKRSAHAYQAIWTAGGSPLLLNARKQGDALAQALPEGLVEVAMRYGNPGLREGLERLAARGAQHVTLVPMYPQEAQATSGTTIEAFTRTRGGGPSAVLPAFFANEGFLDACAARVRETVEASRAEAVLFSYHGLPVRQVKAACGARCGGHAGRHEPCGPLGAQNVGCYRAQCYATSAAIVARAHMPLSTTAFQSRLKGTAWLGPFTDEVVVRLAQQGLKRLAVACPSFVADCLETLEEIGQRARDTFVAAGGEALALVPAVNDDPRFIAGLARAIRAQWQQEGTP